MDLSSKELLEASENLPFPTGKDIQYVEIDDDGTIQSICDDIFELIDDDLIFKTSVENLKKLSTLLNAVNKLGGIPQNINISGLENIINKHNLYINKSNIDVLNALINFVSSSMYNIGKDPVNQIQGEESVDSEEGAVNTIKKLSANLPYSKKLNDIDAGSLTSHYRTRALTMGGKTDTGIVASSLKVFEAYYQYICNILNNGSLEDKANLLINQEICGKLVKLIANSHQLLDTELPPEVALALNEIDLSVDAALLYSGFLSLATDNAKDPTLPKINALESMIGLYLAGITLGLDVKTLINLLTSETALKIANLIPANSFTGESGYSDVKSVLKFIKIGPKDFDLDDVLNKALKSFNELPDFFKKNPTVKNLNKLTAKQYKIFEKCLTASAVKKSTLNKINETREQLKNWGRLKDSVKFNTFITSNGLELNAFDEILKLCFMLGEMQSFTMGARLNLGLPNSLSEQINWMRRFEGILSSRVDTILLLEGSITPEQMKEILQPLQDYNKKLMANDGVTDDLLVKPNLNQVDFIEFVKNPEYLLLIIDTYDKLKFGINVFKAFVTVPHYHGYMQTAAALFTLTSSISSVWNMTNFISKYYLNSMRGDKTSREKLLSSAVDYINGSFIDEFLKTYNFGFGEGKLPNSGNNKVLQEQIDGTLKLVSVPTNYNLTLGTYEGNMTFKYIFEQFIIPNLKSMYPNNELLKSLGFVKTDKTLDKNTLIKLATQTKLLPENTYEEEKIAHYKQGLNIIRDVKIPELGNIHFLDALYIYNLIVNQNAVRENSLTTLFESYMFNSDKKSFEGLTDLILKFFDFLKTSPNYIFAKIKQFGRDDLVNFLKKIAPIDNNFTTGLPYIRKVNPATGKTVLLELDPNKHKKLKQSSDDSEGYIDEDYNIENDENNDEVIKDGEYDGEAAQALENQRKSFFLRQIDESNYYVIDNTITNPTVVNNLSMSTIKEQVVPVSGELTQYKEITWNNIKDLKKVKILGAKSMTDLFIKLGIMNKSGSLFIRDISVEDLMDILKTDC